jgi:hypothetical protein
MAHPPFFPITEAMAEEFQKANKGIKALLPLDITDRTRSIGNIDLITAEFLEAAPGATDAHRYPSL